MTKNKNILLCSVNSKYIHSSPAVWYLKTAAEVFAPQSGFDISIYEGTVNDTDGHLLYNILKTKPDVIGFSVYIWNVEKITALCKNIRAVFPEIKIILGGPEVSCGVEHTGLKDGDYDFIVSGEGEKAFCAEMFLACGEAVPKNIDYEINGKVVKSQQIKNLDEIPFIYNEENIGNFKNKIIYYESSRGCPFSCAYCLSSICGKVRFLPLERVFSDLDFFIDHSVGQVKFVDRTFNCSKERAVKIWEYILRRSGDSETNFHFEIGADLLNEKALQILEK
ncbi:MAG: cobalamin-dependent protein, partial [Clostridia bacterium]|nr:cobalamin-dependent protein [Clostridia bacterium]